jgi:hypothetical protein
MKNSLGLMVTSVTKGGTPGEIALTIKIFQTYITIHWKALEEHFLMVPLVFRVAHFRAGNAAFSEFFLRNSLSILKESSVQLKW